MPVLHRILPTCCTAVDLLFIYLFIYLYKVQIVEPLMFSSATLLPSVPLHNHNFDSRAFHLIVTASHSAAVRRKLETHPLPTQPQMHHCSYYRLVLEKFSGQLLP